MCFFNSQNKRALALAGRYGRKSDIVEIARDIIEEQKQSVTGYSGSGIEGAVEAAAGDTDFPSQITHHALQNEVEFPVQKAFLYPECWIVTSNPALQQAKWGLIPFWVREIEKAESIRKMTANARSETVLTMPSFRDAIRKRRCLIPSTGFYEYHHQGKEAIPYRIFVRDTEVFSLAGVWDAWRHPETKELIKTFSVLTVPANELCAFIHNGGRNQGRMPAIIPIGDEDRWLSAEMREDEMMGMLRAYDNSQMESCVMDRDYLRRA